MADKIADPGAEPGAPKGTLEWLIGFIRRHPSCTLVGGEGAKLVEEIDRLNESLENARAVSDDE
jgi:hypothetical protein